MKMFICLSLPFAIIKVCLSFQCNNLRRTGLLLSGLSGPTVKNKHIQICYFVTQNKLDFLAITETWLSEQTEPHIEQSRTPAGFSFNHKPRQNETGGGTGLIIKSTIKCKNIPTQRFRTFEFQEYVLLLEHCS